MGNVAPRDADELEIWEIAVLLGHADELDDPDDPDGRHRRRRNGHTPDVASARADRAAAARARNRARLAAARGDGPPPEAEPVDPGTLRQLGDLSRAGPRNS